jgi:hypothetical protein
MRAEILSAFYTILLGNPTLKLPRNAPMKTRFKRWWRLVGSAVEHAAILANPDREVDFQKLFLARDEEDEDTTSLADALAIMAREWPVSFCAAQVSVLVNDLSKQNGAALREFLYPGIATNYTVRPVSVGIRLKQHLDNPVKHDGRTLILRKLADDDHKGRYSIERRID